MTKTHKSGRNDSDPKQNKMARRYWPYTVDNICHLRKKSLKGFKDTDPDGRMDGQTTDPNSLSVQMTGNIISMFHVSNIVWNK